MIWKRLRRYADEREKAEEAEAPPAEDEPRVTFRERLLMTLVAYAVIFVPCVVVLLGLALLVCWMIGLL